MFVQKEIEETRKKSLYDFLSTFLFMENKKDNIFYKVFIYIYFKIKQKFIKRYKSIKLVKFYFTLISIEYTYIQPTHIVNIPDYYDYLKKRLSIIAMMNYANVNELIFMFISSYTFRFLLNNSYEKRYPISRHVTKSYLGTYAHLLVKFEKSKNNGLFDFLKYKEAFTQLYFRFKFLQNQFIINSKEYRRRMCTLEYIDFYDKVSEIMFWFRHEDLRETDFNIGQNIKKDPNWKETFYRVNLKTRKMLLTMHFARKLLRKTVSKYVNTEAQYFKMFQDDDTPFWHLLTKYINWKEISNIEYTKIIKSQNVLEDNFTNLENLNYLHVDDIFDNNDNKYSNININRLQKPLITSENITLIDSVYSLEEEYVKEFKRHFYVTDSNIFETKYKPRARKDINILKLTDGEISSNDLDEFKSIPSVELRSLPKDFWKNLKLKDF